MPTIPPREAPTPSEARARTSVAAVVAAAAAASFRVTIAAASGERSAPPPDEDARDAAMTRVAVASFASSFVGSAALAETASTNAASNAGRRHRDATTRSALRSSAPRSSSVSSSFSRMAASARLRSAASSPGAASASSVSSHVSGAARAIDANTVAAASVAGSNPASVGFEDRLFSRHLAASARASPPGRHAAPCASTKDAMRVACARSNEDDALVVAANRGAANFAPTQPVDDASETPLAPFLARAAARSASWNARARAAPGGSTLAPRSSSRVTVAISAAAATPRHASSAAVAASGFASSVANISHSVSRAAAVGDPDDAFGSTRASASGAHRSVTIVRASPSRKPSARRTFSSRAATMTPYRNPSRVARRSAVASAARDGVQHTSHPDQHAANMSPKKLWIGVPPSVLSGRLGEASASAGRRERSGRSDGAEADASPWHPDARCSTSAGTVSVTGSTSDHLEGSGLAWRYPRESSRASRNAEGSVSRHASTSATRAMAIRRSSSARRRAEDAPVETAWRAA